MKRMRICLHFFTIYTSKHQLFWRLCVTPLFFFTHIPTNTHLPKPKAEISTGAHSVAKNNLWNILLWSMYVCVSVKRTHQFNRGILSHVYLVNHRQLNFCVETWPMWFTLFKGRSFASSFSQTWRWWIIDWTIGMCPKNVEKRSSRVINGETPGLLCDSLFDYWSQMRERRRVCSNH